MAARGAGIAGPRTLGSGVAVLLIVAACRSAPPVDRGIVTSWMRELYALVRAERLSPPVASRVFAYGAITLYEALAPGSPSLRSLAGQLNGLQRRSEEHTSELQSRLHLVCRLLLEKKNKPTSTAQTRERLHPAAP